LKRKLDEKSQRQIGVGAFCFSALGRNYFGTIVFLLGLIAEQLSAIRKNLN